MRVSTQWVVTRDDQGHVHTRHKRIRVNGRDVMVLGSIIALGGVPAIGEALQKIGYDAEYMMSIKGPVEITWEITTETTTFTIVSKAGPYICTRTWREESRATVQATEIVEIA